MHRIVARVGLLVAGIGTHPSTRSALDPVSSIGHLDGAEQLGALKGESMGLIRLDQIRARTLAEGITARVVTADTMTVAHVHLAAGATLPEHRHEQEQVVNVIEGHLELVVEGQSVDLTPGKVFVLPSNVLHGGRAVSDCRVIDVFHPVREDLRDSDVARSGG